MTVTIELRWNNPDHPLLHNGTIGFLLDGVPIKARSPSKGVKYFDIEDRDIVPGKTTLLLKGVFTFYVDNDVNLMYFGKYVRTVKPMSGEVLTVRQKYIFINTTMIDPVIEAPFTGPHPLLRNTIIQKFAWITVDTNFVDVTDFWKNYAVDWDVFERDCPAGITFKALAYTGDQQNNWIWLASFPTVCETKPALGVLVHFPYAQITYTQIGQSHDMWFPNRYLLNPDPTDPPDDPVRGLRFSARIRPNPPPLLDEPFVDYYVRRAGFLKSLLDSGKAVVLFYLVPKMGNQPVDSFGPVTVRPILSEMTESALKVLHAQGVIGKGQYNVTKNRLGISVYSGAGYSVYPALNKNSDFIDEFYEMDGADLVAVSKTVRDAILRRQKLPENQKNHFTYVMTWFINRVDAGANPCLRMTGWLQRNANKILFNELSPEPGGSVSVSPPPDHEDAFFTLPTIPPDPAKPDEHGSAWWNECLTTLHGQAQNNARHDGDVRHQFPLQGGPGAPADGHYMYHFLKDSRFL